MNAYRPRFRNAARISWVDRKTGVVWIDSDGLTAETVWNLKHYGVRAVASDYSGRVGVVFTPDTPQEVLGVFAESARVVVDFIARECSAVNTSAKGLARNLVILQGLQESMKPAAVSDEERLVSEWVNGRGGVA